MKPAMIRSVDAQGRIILPVEIRRTMGISDGDMLEIHPAENGIYLSKYKNNSVGDQRIKIPSSPLFHNRLQHRCLQLQRSSIL